MTRLAPAGSNQASATTASLGAVEAGTGEFAERQDGFMSHAEYSSDCPHIDEDCQCEDDETVMWELMEFSGGEW